MSSRPGYLPEMEAPDSNNARLEARLRSIAAAFPYPQTPDLAGRERQRLANQKRAAASRRTSRLAMGLALLVFVLLAALLASPVRARVLDWISIGAVRIFFNLPTLTVPPPVPFGTAVPSGTPDPFGSTVPPGTPVPPRTPMPSGTPTPEATPTYLRSVLDLAGETSLSKAQEQAGFTVELPAYPPDLGQPDYVYLQQYDRRAIILVWMDPGQPGEVRMSLTKAPSGTYIFEKYRPTSVLDTQVNGQPAVWVEGDYLLVTRTGDNTLTRLVTQGHTLIWTNGDMTFRLETDVDLETAIRIAESIP